MENIEVQRKKKISYVNIDSSQRNIYPINTYDHNYRKLLNNPLLFTNNSDKIIISDPNHNFQPGQLISLSNVVSSINIFENIVMIKNSSMYMRIFHPEHNLSVNANTFERVNYIDRLPETFTSNDIIPDIDNKYYIAIDAHRRIFINIRGIKGTDVTGNFIGNIPVNTINGIKEVILIYTYVNGKYVVDNNSYLIKLEEPSNINYLDGIISDNTVYINFMTLFGIPLNLINSGTPINAQQRVPYLAIVDSDTDTYTVEISVSAIVPNNIDNGGGNNIVVRRVISTTQGYPNANSFILPLTETYRNISQVKIVASAFPNSQRTITILNNRIYWRDLDSGSHIYNIEVTPGNYSANDLECVMEKLFSKIPLMNYDIDTDESYDRFGNYKYHIIKVNIDTNTDIVSFRSFREQFIHDSLGQPLVITVPNNKVFFFQASNLTNRTVMLNIYNNITNIIAPFNPTTQDLFIFFTNKSHIYIDKQFPYIYGNVYKYVEEFKQTQYFSYSAIRENVKAFLFNFVLNSRRELHSVNTNTKLVNFTYNPTNNNVFLPDNRLKVNDLIITDQFVSLTSINFQTSGSFVKIYVINKIIDDDNFHIIEYDLNGAKMIYSNYIINFSQMILPLDMGTELIPNSTLSFVDVIPVYENDNTMIINHKHTLMAGDKIIIKHSVAVNRVPEDIINQEHVIHRVIDNNSYLILLNPYTPLVETVFQYNSISILYPTQIQLLFNYKNTLGNYLGFHDVGQETSVTIFSHIITNQTSYEIPLNYSALGEGYIQSVKKLSFTGPNYCYIQCLQLGRVTYNNTTPVLNVLNKIRWFDIPGSVIYDSFEPVTSYFEDYVRNLSQIHVNILNPDGSFYDFNGLNYSFTLEITEIYREVVDIIN